MTLKLTQMVPAVTADEFNEIEATEQLRTVRRALDTILSALHCIYPKAMLMVTIGPLVMVYGTVMDVL